MVEWINSSSCNVTSGVPQGSVLGTVLFLMYINDIGLSIHSEIRLFADDILLYHPIRTPDDHAYLQEDLNTLTKYPIRTPDDHAHLQEDLNTLTK